MASLLRQGGEPPSTQVTYMFFMQAEKANHRVSAMCRTLKVSKSGFYGWRNRPPSKRAKVDARLSEQIAHIHKDSRGIYGAPRIHFELRTLGVRCARKRVARLMREAGLEKPVSSAAEAVVRGCAPLSDPGLSTLLRLPTS